MVSILNSFEETCAGRANDQMEKCVKDWRRLKAKIKKKESK